MTDDFGEITLVTDKAKAQLDPRQLEAYKEHRRRLLTWLRSRGKNPKKREGYADSTVRQRAYRLDYLYRRVWKAEGHYTENITTDHADAWMEELADSDYSKTYKAACQKAAHSLFKWQRHDLGKSVYWTPRLNFSDDSGMHNPRDILTRDERNQLREAALEYGSIPHYASVTPEEREEWKRHLAQRFGKPIDDIGLNDWERANGWKYTSMLWTALDAGLRPAEVGQATVSWVDNDNGVLRIPKEDSVKNRDNWRVSLLDKTVFFLEKWLEERELYDQYDETDALWLTNCGNPYGSQSLNRLFRRLCDEAEIDLSDRELTWYSIRHSVGTYMTREGDLSAAAAQLRHRSIRSTLKYDQAPVEDRQDALERMG